MTYNDILEIDNVEEKEKVLRDFYINEVKVLDWMYDKNKYQHIVFKDREEYKFNNKFHRLDGPAVVCKNGTEYYYIYGEIMNKEKWKVEATKLLREKKLKKVLN